MVADIEWLQGKVVEDPTAGTKNVSKLIQELALEILAEEEIASKAADKVRGASE